jgi:alpha-L-fucosidase
MKLHIAWLSLIVLLFVACDNTPPPAPHGPLPSERQLAWHDLEYYAFVHFNMNTFTNMEWGMGDEKPEWFNPTELDTRQWARVAKEAGMKGIIITAKHHDGFCLWPSAYTEHSVKNSPWRDGKGDVLRELADACKEYGLKFGVYLSPWDRNHADYGKPEYLDYFRNQLRELLTNYGEVFEVWFDGANGGTGYYGGANENRKIDNRTYYEWDTVFEIVRELQPMACIFSDGGPDVRWVGNEEGWARPTNWSLLKRDDFAPGIAENLEHLRAGQEDGTHWLPAEVDVSIRPGWYYHPYEDHKVKTLPQLLDIYYHSVGRNASFLLNFPVDARGLIHENDVEAVMKLAEALKADFANDLAIGQKITATNVRGNSNKFGTKNLTDGKTDTYWATDDDVTEASLTIEFSQPTTFNRLLMQEYIPLGQRVKKFKVEYLQDGDWQTLAEETTIGYKRILRLRTITTTQLRVTIEDSKAAPVLSNLQVFNAPKVLEAPVVTRNKEGEVTIVAADEGVDVYYTTDGTDPGTSSQQNMKELFCFSRRVLLKPSQLTR